MQSKEPNKFPEKEKSGANSFIRYTDVAFRMIVIILVGVFAGVKLDEWLELETPVFTLILSLMAVASAMYIVIKGVSKQ